MPQPYPGQQWKHGWIPMTGAAVKSKNHGRGGNRDVIARIAAEAGAVLRRMESGSKPGNRGSSMTPAVKAPTRSRTAPKAKPVASKGTGQDTSKKIDAAIRLAAGRTPPSGSDRHQTGDAGNPVRKPMSPEQASAAQAEMLKETPWTPAQREALREYTNGWASEINGLLRNGGDASKIVHQFTRDTAAAMKPLPRAATLYRYVALDAFDVKTPSQLHALIGQTRQDRGFLSTSLARDGHTDPHGQMRLAAGRPVLMEIDAPAGSRAAYVDGLSGHPGQWEIILNAGTKYQITGVTDEGAHTVVRVRVTP